MDHTIKFYNVHLNMVPNASSVTKMNVGNILHVTWINARNAWKECARKSMLVIIFNHQMRLVTAKKHLDLSVNSVSRINAPSTNHVPNYLETNVSSVKTKNVLNHLVVFLWINLIIKWWNVKTNLCFVLNVESMEIVAKVVELDIICMIVNVILYATYIKKELDS